MTTELIVREYDPDDKRIGSSVADRILATAILETLDKSVGHITEHGGWDQPSMFAFLYLGSRTPLGSGMTAGFEGLMIEMHPMAEVSQAMLDGNSCQETILRLAKIYQDGVGTHPPMPIGLVGVLVIHEAWMVRVPIGDEQAVQRLTADGRAQTLHTRPDRVEVRQAIAVDMHQTVYMVQHARDGEKQMVCDHSGVPGSFGGNIPYSLEYLMLSFMERTLPPYKEWLTETGRLT